VNNTVVSLRDVCASNNVTRPLYIAGKWQRDNVTGALQNISIPTVMVEFDSFSDYEWGWGNSRSVNGNLNASANLLNNCLGALSTKDAWFSKKYHISGCTAEVHTAV
jgi:hypothetical protein